MNSVGTMLRTAREQHGLSTLDIATRLRMGINQVNALEGDDYAALPTGTFLRGFVRNFAREVAVAPERALALLEQTRGEAAPNASAVVIPSQQNIAMPIPGGDFQARRGRRILAVSTALVLLLAIFWWWWEYVWPNRADAARPRPPAVESADTQPTGMVVTPIITPPREPVIDTVSATAESAAAPVVTRVDAPVAAAVAPPTNELAAMPLSLAPTVTVAPLPATPRAALRPGSGQLSLTFSGKSWVEIVDANGKSVIDRTYVDGQSEAVVARAPVMVVIGNAQATRLLYNGSEIDLRPHTRASVARVTLK